MSVASPRLRQLLDLQHRILERVQKALEEDRDGAMARTVRDDEGDTIFGIDEVAEEVLIPACEAWGETECFVLIAEGIEPSTGRIFGKGTPQFRLIMDPVDGSRGLMYDKRSAWSLGAIAEDHGNDTRLSHVLACAMTELPTSKQRYSDRLFLDVGSSVAGEQLDLVSGQFTAFEPKPSRAIDLRHGFATVSNFFPGGKALIAHIDDRIMQQALGGWNFEKAEVYADQYISSGGQLAELVLGRDRFVMDIRPLIHRRLGVTSSLCARPYDLCTVAIAIASGCVVTTPEGKPLDAPLDTTTNMAFVAYANRQLAINLQPVVMSVLQEAGLA